MKSKPSFNLSILVLAMGLSSQVHAADQATSQNKQAEQDFEKIRILGVRSSRVSQGATGLVLEINETPQSMSVVTADMLKKYNATNLNDSLRLATGIGVEEWETNRTNYTARGFEIKNTQTDGVGLPNNWGIVTGSMEAYGYEEIEIIRGANGLLTGVGNAAGTINYVRKRPTNENTGEVRAFVGAYDYKRLEADYSMLLTEDGSWAARVVAAAEDKESHLDGLSNDRSYLYAVVDGQLTDQSTLTLGFSHQDANTDGNLWGGLVFNYTDGTQAEWDVSDTTTQDWTQWDTLNTTAFVEYTYLFDNDWEVKATYNQQDFEDQSKLFYAYGSIDKNTNLGLVGWPGKYDSTFDAQLFDITVTGEFTLFGETHQTNFGVSRAKSEQLNYEYAADSGFDALPAFPYPLSAIAEPNWGEQSKYTDIDVTLTRAFGSAKFTINKDLLFIAGFNSIDYKREGVNSGTDIYNHESEISPFAGFTYSISEDINAYLSYSDIYQPQEQYNEQGEFLDPTKGVNVEIGTKIQWFDDKLLTTFAIFSAEQQDLSAFAGIRQSDGRWYYKGIDVESEGFEIEAVGKVTDNLNLLVAYTSLDVKDDQGNDAHEWAARNVVNFSVDYTFPQLPELNIGLGGRWQSKTRNADYSVQQGAYLLANAYVRWTVSDALSIQANINNLTDEKYINSLLNVGYYGAPRNATVSVSYKF